MTDLEPKPSSSRDYGTLLILVALIFVGVIPWWGVLEGEPPAYSADAGAVVAITATFLLIWTLLDMRGQARASRGAASRKSARGENGGERD